jgi:hypothetical protein
MDLLSLEGHFKNIWRSYIEWLRLELWSILGLLTQSEWNEDQKVAVLEWFSLAQYPEQLRSFIIA